MMKTIIAIREDHQRCFDDHRMLTICLKMLNFFHNKIEFCEEPSHAPNSITKLDDLIKFMDKFMNIIVVNI